MNLTPTEAANVKNPMDLFQAHSFYGGRPAGKFVSEGSLKPCDSRLKWHVPGTVANSYGLDRSGTVDYSFNSLGYRSEEYRSDAKFRVCIVGESHAFGTGVHFEDTFGFNLKVLIAETLNLELDEVNLINLAIGGSSADYCARTVFRQLPTLAADFVVCIIPPPDRIEFRQGEGFNTFGVGSVDVDNLDKLPVPLLGFCEYYSRLVGGFNQVKNILLIENFLRSHNIEFVIAVENFPWPGDGVKPLDPFLAELDEDRLLRHEFFRQRADFAADGSHAGPRSHKAFAIQVFHHYGCLLRVKGMSDIADVIEIKACQLMSEDDDFKFCTMAS